MEAKKFINFSLIVLAFLGVIFTLVYALTILQDSGLYNNSTSTYASSVTDPMTGEKLSPLAVSYFENYNNLGKEVVEFKIRAYSDSNKQALYERGYQLIIDEENGNDLWYYDTVYGTSFPSGHPYDETTQEGQAKEFYYIDIDDELVALKLDGYSTTYKTKTNGWKIFRTIATLGTNLIFEDTNYEKTEVETHYYTMEELLLGMKDIVKGSSYGSGEYTMPLIDLGEFLHIYEVNNGTIADEPIGSGTLINSYFAVDIKYDRRGLSYAGQSMFGSVANDSNYNVTGIDFDVNYWTSHSIYNISQNDFEMRYSELNNGYYFSLSSDLINELKNYDNLDIYINFDLSVFDDISILGFDYYALNGIKVANLTITSDVNSNFVLMQGSLDGTNIEKINIHNVTVENNSGLEVEYEVV